MPLDDAALLKRWIARRDAEAFDEIVRRFADQVYGTCLRILRNDADAQEVSQECFLHFVRAGGDVRSSLGGWLHRTAATKSLDRIRRDASRRAREQAYGDTADDAQAPVDVAWSEIQWHVDGAIETLPDTTREVIIAHFLGRKTHAEIAKELRVSRRAVTYRIERGLESIRRELRKRGVVVSAAALGASLITEASAAPISLKASLGKLAIAAGATSGAGGGIATSDLLGSLILMKAKISVACAVVCILFAGIAYYSLGRPDTAPEAPAAHLDPVTAAPAVPDRPETVADERPPVAVKTDLEDSPTIEDLLALSHSALERELDRYAPIEEPDQDASVSGVVLDRDGYPIAGASVLLTPQSHWGKLPRVDELSRAVSTGTDGAYILDQIEHTGHYWVNATKPGYADGARGATTDTAIKIEPGSHATGIDFTLDTGPALRGRVLSASGVPVPDGIVQGISVVGPSSASMMQRYSARTDEGGYFVMGFHDRDLGAVASLRVQSTLHGSKAFPDVVIQEDRLVVLRLSAPAVVHGTVRFGNGEPVPDAFLNFFGSKQVEVPDGETVGTRETSSFAGAFYAVCDREGRYAVQVDAGLEYEVEVSSGGAAMNEKRSKVAALESGERRAHNLVLDENFITVRGRLIGLPSLRPLVSYVSFLEVVGRSEDGREAGRNIMNVDGTYELVLPGVPGRYTFQALYSFMSTAAGEVSETQTCEGGEELEVDLTVPEPQYFSVFVVDPAGAPQAGAYVDFDDSFVTNERTNADGRLDKPFAMPPACGTRVVVRKAGFVSAFGTLFDDQSPGTVHPEDLIVLRPGAGFEGDVVDGEGQPLSGTTLRISVSNRQGDQWLIQVRTDGNGHFTVVEQAPADVVDVAISGGEGAGLWEGGHVTLEAGTITDLGVVLLE